MSANLVIKIKATNLPLTPAIEKYARKKMKMLEKLLGAYAEKSGEIIFDIEIGRTTKRHKQGNVFRAEINFTAGDIHLRTESEKDDIYAAVDEAKDEMQRRLRRGKEKYLKRVKRGTRALKERFLRR